MDQRALGLVAVDLFRRRPAELRQHDAGGLRGPLGGRHGKIGPVDCEAEFRGQRMLARGLGDRDLAQDEGLHLFDFAELVHQPRDAGQLALLEGAALRRRRRRRLRPGRSRAGIELVGGKLAVERDRELGGLAVPDLRALAVASGFRGTPGPIGAARPRDREARAFLELDEMAERRLGVLLVAQRDPAGQELRLREARAARELVIAHDLVRLGHLAGGHRLAREIFALRPPEVRASEILRRVAHHLQRAVDLVLAARASACARTVDRGPAAGFQARASSRRRCRRTCWQAGCAHRPARGYSRRPAS